MDAKTGKRQHNGMSTELQGQIGRSAFTNEETALAQKG